jgi:hypothetical protein
MAKFALACTSIISSSVLVRCLLFPTLQLFRCFPGGARRAIASANGAKESISWPAFHVKASPLISLAARWRWRVRGVVRISPLPAYVQYLAPSHGTWFTHCVARGLRASDRLRVDTRTRLKAAEIS